MCNCERNLVETANTILTDIGIRLDVFICEDCKQYYVKVNAHIVPVKFNHSISKWELWNGLFFA